MKNAIFYNIEDKKYFMNYKAPDAFFMMKDILKEEENEEDKKYNESIYARLVFCV